MGHIRDCATTARQASIPSRLAGDRGEAFAAVINDSAMPSLERAGAVREGCLPASPLSSSRMGTQAVSGRRHYPGTCGSSLKKPRSCASSRDI